MNGTVSSPTSRLERSVQQVFLLALFCVPFATALTNFFVGLLYLGFLLMLATRKDLRGLPGSPPAILALGLLALFLLGCLWTIAPQPDMASALRKYSRLLILPIGLSLSLRDPSLGRRALRSFMGGAAVLAVSTYLVRFGVMPTSSLGWWRVGEAKDAFAFKNHITVGILLGFAVAVCALAASYAASASRRALPIAACVLLTVPIVFLGQGRTGYVALFIGLATVFLLRAAASPRRALAGLAALVLAFGGFYATSANFKSRTDDMVTELRTGRERSPNGVRLSFLQTGLQMVADHPLVGQGTGSFAEAYAPTARRVWAGVPEMSEARHQPHSEWLLVTVQLGVLGLSVYLAMLGALLRPTLARRSFDTDVLLLLVAIFGITSVFNSLLWDTTEAHWFLLLSGALYAGAARTVRTD